MTRAVRLAPTHQRKKREGLRKVRQHNDANVLSMGERVTGIEVARACVREFLAGEFQGGRHVPRIEKISRIEAEEAGR